MRRPTYVQRLDRKRYLGIAFCLVCFVLFLALAIASTRMGDPRHDAARAIHDAR